MIIMIIASGFIARKIGDKATVTAGLVIAAVFGVIPFFVTNNFWVIMGSRIGLGVGFGLINSLAVSMIAKFFSGDEKATLMGFRSAFESLGQSLMPWPRASSCSSAGIARSSSISSRCRF